MASDRHRARGPRRNDPRLLAGSGRRYLKTGEIFAIDARIVQQDGPRAFFWLFGPPVFENERIGNVCVVRISGPLEHHSDYWGDSYEDIVCRVEEGMRGDDVCRLDKRRNGWREDYEPIPHPGPPTHVVLRIDSPGGVVAGLHQAHLKLRRLSEQYGVELVAYVDEMAYSAAFNISCACSEIVLPPSGFLGSIGVISTMVDQTARDRKDGYRFVVLTSGKRKADGHPHVAITDEMLDAERPRIQTLARFFYEDVREGRGLSIGRIRGFEAARFLGVEAKVEGLADWVLGWDDLLDTLLTDEARAEIEAADRGKAKGDGAEAIAHHAHGRRQRS